MSFSGPYLSTQVSVVMADPLQRAAPQFPKFSSAPNRSVHIFRAFHQIGWPLLAYFIASVATRAYFMGDTVDYAHAIAMHLIGRDYYFWEFGHVLWRPLGFLVLRILQPLAAYIAGTDPRLQATVVLLVLSWLAGLLSVLSLYGILNRICGKRWVVLTTTIAFICALSFLNYFHSGPPYVSGLSLILLALYILNKDQTISLKRSILAGVVLGGAVCLWFPYVLVTPAVVLSTAFLQGFDKRRVVIAIQTLTVAAVLTLGVYIGVALHIGVHTPGQFKVWMQLTSGDAATTPNKGVTKMIFGFARAFVSMGSDGMLFKRYLLRDPFNPVSFFYLAVVSLWKILGFYLFLATTTLSLLTSPGGRRVLGLLAAAAGPTLAFAIYWQGGDPERYLALFPFLLISVAVSLNEPARPVLRYIVLVFLIGASAVNVAALATHRLNRQQEASAGRIRALLPTLKPRSIVVTANCQDELVNFSRTFPFNPVNRDQNLHIDSVITPGASDVDRWRQVFRKKAESVWSDGGDVWISLRLLASRPNADWNWVEGDDPRISWTDLVKFFSQCEVGQAFGGDDGFVLLVPSEKNRAILKAEATTS